MYADTTEQHLSELAHHFTECAVGNDVARGIAFNVRAGNAAMSAIAYESAVLHLERAIALAEAQSQAPSRETALMLITLGSARYASGQPSTDTFVRAAETARDAGAFDVMMRAILREPPLSGAGPSNAALWPFINDRFDRLLREALESLSDGYGALKACGLAYHSFLLRDAAWMTSSALASLAVSDEAEAAARKLVDPRALAYVLYWQQFALSNFPQHAERQAARASELNELAVGLGDRALIRAAHMWQAFSLMALGDPSMDEHLQEFHKMSEELRQPQPSWWSAACIAMRMLMKGDLADAERQMIAAVQIGQRAYADAHGETGDPGDVSGTFSQQFFTLRREQGRLGEVRQLVRDAVEQFPEIPSWRAALALTHLESGQADLAIEIYQSVVSDIENLPSTSVYNVTLPIAGEICGQLEDADHAAWFYSQLEPYQERIMHVSWRIALGAADRLLGVLAGVLSRYHQAERHFEVALDIHERIGARPLTARTQLDYARMLRKRGAERDRAQELLHAALATAKEIGMAKVAADCEALLKQ
jgi:tetratricopeptide (TPR) repeat protein